MTDAPTIDIDGLVAGLRRRAVRREWTGDPIDGGVGWVEHRDSFLDRAADALEASNERIRELEGALAWAMSQIPKYSRRIPNQNAAFCDGWDSASAALSRKDTPDAQG